MAIQRFPSNSNNSATVTQAGATVVTPTRVPAGGGRITGSRIAAVNSPFLGPQPGGFPVPPGGLGTPIGNPGWPCLAGPQIQPLATTTVPIDTGTGYFFRHMPSNEIASNNNVLFASEFAPSPTAQQHMVAFDYFQGGTSPTAPDNSQTYTAPVTYVCQPLSVVTSVGSPVWNPRTQVAGTGTQIQALANIGGMCLRMDGNTPDSINVNFDTSAITNDGWGFAGGNLGGRVVEVGLRYRAWRQSSTDPAGIADPAPSEGFSVFYHDSTYPGGALNLFLASWLVPNYYSVSGSVTTKSLGEVNWGARGYATAHGVGGAAYWAAHPYTIEDMTNFDTGPLSIQLRAQVGTGANQRFLYLDHIEMVVRVVPERRTAAAIRVVSSVYNDPTTTPPQVLDSSYSHFSTGLFPESSTLLPSLATSPQVFYDLCIREALPVDTSDLLIVQPSVGVASLFEAIGPSLQILGVIQYQQTQYPQLQTFTGTIIDGQLKSKELVPFEDYNLSVNAFFADGVFWASYREEAAQGNLDVWGANTVTEPVFASGGTQYSYVHVVARPPALPNTGADPLILTIVDTATLLTVATGTITSAAVEALPDVGDGWHAFELAITPPFTPAVSHTYNITASSPGSSQLGQWQIAGSWPTGRLSTLGYPYVSSAINYAMFLACTMATPIAPTVTLQSAVSDTMTCDVGVLQWAQITWTPDTSVDSYGIENSLDGVTWNRVAIIETEGSVAVQTYNDYGMPWDVPVFYRLVAYRMPDRLELFGPAAASITASSGGAVLGLSTMDDAFIYSPVDPNQVNIQWTDLNTVTLVQLHGENFQRALRETFDRGLRFTVQVLVANIGSCSPGSLTVAQQSLSETAFEDIRALEREEFILVRFPGGPVRRMTLELGGMNVVTPYGVYLATLTLTDVNIDPMLFSADEFSPGTV